MKISRIVNTLVNIINNSLFISLKKGLRFAWNTNLIRMSSNFEKKLNIYKLKYSLVRIMK